MTVPVPPVVPHLVTSPEMPGRHSVAVYSCSECGRRHQARHDTAGDAVATLEHWEAGKAFHCTDCAGRSGRRSPLALDAIEERGTGIVLYVGVSRMRCGSLAAEGAE